MHGPVNSKNRLVQAPGFHDCGDAAFACNAFNIKFPVRCFYNTAFGRIILSVQIRKSYAVEGGGFFQLGKHEVGNFRLVQRMFEKICIGLDQLLGAGKMVGYPFGNLSGRIFGINPVLLLDAITVLHREAIKKDNYQADQDEIKKALENFIALAAHAASSVGENWLMYKAKSKFLQIVKTTVTDP